MFMGEYHPTLDEKGRIAIPARLRRALGDDLEIQKLVVTYGFDRCLMAFPERDWKQFVEEKIVPLSQGDPANRMRVRFLLGGAAECELDRQGRIVMPAYLQEYGEISRDITILGVYDRIEIWSTELYARYRPDGESLDDFARDLGF